MANLAVQGAAQQSKPPLTYRVYRWAWWLLDALYPPVCGGCGAQAYARLCDACRQQARPLQPPLCPVCGEPTSPAGLCRRCIQHPPAFTALRSWAEFCGPLQKALQRLKYQRDLALGDELARPLVEILYQLAWPVDLITPVPIGVDRQAERGYNQATFLALPVALAHKIPYRPAALKKVRTTRSQVGLTASQRMVNVVGAFEANPVIVRNQRVLVIDDVTTTGATLQACADALLKSGARQVYGLTLARAIRPSGSGGQ